MILHKTFPCDCGAAMPLQWQTVDRNNLIVHGVPVYVCPVCGDETLELLSACVYDAQVTAAFDCGLSEITLLYPEIELVD